MRDIIDVAAEAIRTAFGESQKDERPDLYYHIQSTPWDTLPENRKKKWLLMARTAHDTFEEYNATGE